MPGTLTYIDSGVLIFAAQGTSDAAALALPFLLDPAREYVTSDFVRLEVLPKATFHKQAPEIEFYNSFFNSASRTIRTSNELVDLAFEEARKHGINAIDALHIASAVFGGAEEFVTSEKTSKPIHRTTLLKMTSIFPLEPPKKKTWWAVLLRGIRAILNRLRS